jgi:hypothetical protein
MPLQIELIDAAGVTVDRLVKDGTGSIERG